MHRPSPIAHRPSLCGAAVGLFLLAQPCIGQSIYVPPDIFNDAHKGTTVLRENLGQVRKTDGSGCEAYFYYENTPAAIYLMKHSLVSFVLGVIHPDTITPDTLWRVDMKLDKGRDISPIANGSQTGGSSNYYLGAVTAEHAEAYHRAIHPSVWDSVDVHFYHGSSGPRMAFVVRPGGDPSEIQLKFSGQDSMSVDWQGALKVYMGEKWVKLEQALAYQVSGSTTLPVNWSTNYLNDDGSDHVGFEFEAFNPALPLVLQIGYPPMPGPLGGEPDYRNLAWCTYASASDGDELQSVELDNQGDPYVCGFAHQTFYPVAIGEWQFPPWLQEPSGVYNATITKLLHTTKEVVWSTYFGGYDDGGITSKNRTDAYKLAVYNGDTPEEGYVFVTGSTSCLDIQPYREADSRFALADITGFGGGIKRMWLGAFRTHDGERHWATTHGETGGTRTWNEHGLAIDVDSQGRLVVGGKIETYFNWSTTPDFPRVTPTGAFTRALGDGFFIVFNDQYQIDWSSTFCEFSEAAAHGGVFDLKLTKKNSEPSRGFYMVGATADVTSAAFNLVPPLPGGYFQAVAGPVSAFLAFVNIDTRQLEYATRWGSPNPNAGTMGAGFGVALSPNRLWVVGYTNAANLTTAELPPPALPTNAYWSLTNNSVFPQLSDAFVLRFDITQDEHILDYGTLLGGTRDDILLDIAYDWNGRLYMTGETRSFTGFDTDLDAGLYHQAQQNLPARDAILLRMSAGSDPALEWSTVFGGTRSDRGWGVAANATELYLCGTTASQGNPFTGQNFPLREFSTTSLLDYYQDVNLGGTSNEWVPWRDFQDAMDYEDTGIDQWIIEPLMEHDGFIASFLLEGMVSVPEASRPHTSGMRLSATMDPQAWLVQFDQEDMWEIRVFDGAGRLAHRQRLAGSGGIIALGDHAPGIYMIVAVNAHGVRHAAKLPKP